MDIQKWTKTCLNCQDPVSEQIPLAARFHFGQVFGFCILINKNVLEWFLLIICKGHTLTRSTNLFSRNHTTLWFWLRRQGRQISNTEQFVKLTKAAWRCPIKKLFLKPPYTKEYLMRTSRNLLHVCHSSYILLCILFKNS